MYNIEFHSFSEKLLKYQKSISFDSFLGLSEEAMRKINLLAIYKISQDLNYVEYCESIKRDFIDSRRLKLVLRFYVVSKLFLTFLVFHFILGFNELLRKNIVDLSSAKIIFFGSKNSTIAIGYRYLSGIFKNSLFLTLSGKEGLLACNRKDIDFSFNGFKANFKSFQRSIYYTFHFASKFLVIDFIKSQNRHSIMGFFEEYLKVIYSIERSIEIAKSTPIGSINFFMCDNNFFHTVHIDRLNKSSSITAVIQHGSFLEGNIINETLSKWVLCCSEREARLFSSANSKVKVHLLGVPLQVYFSGNLVLSKAVNALPESYDILILGRDGTLWEIDLAYSILKGLNDSLREKSILIRHHPKSIKKARIILESYFQNYTISQNSTLENDISQAKIVV